MPVKFGKTQTIVNRNTKKVTIVHEYMKCKSTQELIDAYNKPVIPKLRQKVKNELVRRGGVVFTPKVEEDSLGL
tara:strand:- start:8447 stop:8668 length:222 start_codon:yes stop_codon:yes gene_type:complete